MKQTTDSLKKIFIDSQLYKWYIGAPVDYYKIFFSSVIAFLIACIGFFLIPKLLNEIKERQTLKCKEILKKLHIIIILQIISIVITLFVIAEIFEIHILTLYNPLFPYLFLRKITIFILIGILGTVVWKGINILLSNIWEGVTDSGKKYIKTIKMLLMTISKVVIITIFFILILSQLGINIVPLLASLGFAGIAVGLAAQNLIRDYIYCIIILSDGIISIGDVITIDDRITGTVEKITMRTIRIRSFNGDLNSVPYGKISIITNQTYGYSYAMINVIIATEEKLEKIVIEINEIIKDLQKDSRLKEEIVGALEILGISKLEKDSAVFSSRLKVKAYAKWRIERRINDEIKLRLENKKIISPYRKIIVYNNKKQQGDNIVTK